ncbi:MAG: hypothetical protein M0C28_06385 [Candidatus Moduliflexus flocculans]|nr:hypothetical protein [Candidatus Moduliflexus flocculans]
MAARAAVFDRALAAHDGLSARTSSSSPATRSRSSTRRRPSAAAPAVPVTGIIDAGCGPLRRRCCGRTRRRLLVALRDQDDHRLRRARPPAGRGCGIEPGAHPSREACHGLAAVIDKDPDAPARARPRRRVRRAGLAPAAPRGTLYAGLACTHYAYVAEVFRTSLAGSPDARPSCSIPTAG